eukprot:Skav235669  [mRNA]  locus=scaffold358:1103709:1108024:+ [translate_table: standard]
MESLLGRLPHQWAAAVKDALSAHHREAFARVYEVRGNVLLAHLGSLSGCRGVVLIEPVKEVSIMTAETFSCQVGDWIGFDGSMGPDAKVVLQSNEQIWRLSPGTLKGGWSCIHLFAGAFGGWSRAFRWLREQGLFAFQKELTIDSDPKVAEVWQVQGCNLLQGAEQSNEASFATWSGFCGMVSNHSWIHQFQDDLDVWLTMSPPCQSWSQGGVTSGLKSWNGIAFIEGIAVVGKLRPVAVTCECSDTIVRHPDFAIVKQAFHEIGYRPIWSDIVDALDTVKMRRRRWVAIYARADIETRSLGNFKITDLAKPNWDDCTFKFFVPQVIKEQLLLTPDLIELYGCFADRIKPGLCHIFHNDDFTWISPEANVVSDLVRCLPSHENAPCQIKAEDVCIGVLPHETLVQFFAKLHWDPAMLCQFQCHSGDDAIPMSTTVEQLVGMHIRITCRGHLIIGGVVLRNDASREPESIPMDVVSVSSSDCTIDDIEASLDDCTASGVSIVHHPECQVTFLMCQTKSIIPEVFQAVQRRTKGYVEIHEIKDIPEMQSDHCVLAIHCRIPESHVVIVWVDAVTGVVSSEMIERVTQSPHIQHGQCFLKQSPREVLALRKGPEAGSDEIEWLASQMNQLRNNCFVHPPIVIDDRTVGGDEVIASFITARWKARSNVQHFMFPVWEDHHWAGVEIQLDDRVLVSMIGFCCDATSRAIVSHIKVFAQRAGLTCHVCHCKESVGHLMCGWSLMTKWAQGIEDTCEWPKCHDSNMIAIAEASFRKSGASVAVLKTVVTMRASFLATCPPCDPRIAFGGADDDATMDQVDPLQVKDPWLRPASVHVRNAKWEDLTLLPDHKFHDEAGVRLPQITRQQMSSNQGGIAFVNRSNVASTLHPPATTAAILVPVTDSSFFAKLSPPPEIVGPTEVTVTDQVAQTVYKRQVTMVRVAKKAVIKESKANYTATLQELCEVVFELDSRLAAKETLSGLQGNAAEFLKSKVHELFPAAALASSVMYGYKKIDRKEYVIHQIMTKVSQANRATILEHSCLGEVSSRDFIIRGSEPSDHSVLPRFWDVNRASREEVLKTASKIDGFAGIIIAKRGLCVRSWNTKLATTRAALMSGDSRLCPENLSTIPRFRIESSGWPSNITASEIVKSVAFYTKLPPLPTKAYRVGGVTNWTLLFSELPQIQKFSASFNGSNYEILLIKPEQVNVPQPRKSKAISIEAKGSGKGKGKSKASGPSAHSEVEAHADRLTSLENRFTLMEKKQNALEDKVDNSFQEVNSQLRQILQAVAPRPASHEQTGYTPPPKHAKTT